MPIYFQASAFTCRLIKYIIKEFNIIDDILRKNSILGYVSFFFLNAKLYNKHIFIYRTVSSCYGNWNLGSSRECIVVIVLWAWRNGIWTSDTGFESHWKRESLLLVPWIPFLNTLFSEKFYIKISTSSPSFLCKNWPTIKWFLLNLLDWK